MEWTMLSCFLFANFLFIQVEPVTSSPQGKRFQVPEPAAVLNSSIPESAGALLQLKDYMDQGNALLKDRLTESYTNLKELLKEGDSVLKDQIVQGVAQVKKQRKEGDERLQEELDDDVAWLKDRMDKGQTRMKEEMAEEDAKLTEELAEQKEAFERLKDSVGQQSGFRGGAVAAGDLGQQMADFRTELLSTQDKMNSMEQELQRTREHLQTAEEEILSLTVRVNSSEACCQKLQESLNSSAGARKLSCDGGFERVCDRCLKAVDDDEDYSSARQDCSDMGGHLAIPKSRGDVACIWNYRQTKGFGRTWLGADDKQEPGVFRWNDETLLPDDSPMWKSDGEPDKHVHGNTCVYLNPDGADLYDFPCQNTYQYICQKDPI